MMMDALMIKILAIGITVSQIFTQPHEQFREKFDPVADQEKVVALLSQGCGYVKTEFKAENIDFDLLFRMVIPDPNAQAQKEADAKREAELFGTEYVPEPAKPVDEALEKLDIAALYAA